MVIAKKCARVTADVSLGEEERRRFDRARGAATACFSITACGMQEISWVVTRKHKHAKRGTERRRVNCTIRWIGTHHSVKDGIR